MNTLGISASVIFWTLAVGSAAVIVAWLLHPLLKWARISKGLSYEEASELIGSHFPEISDRLLNVLQLQNQLGSGDLGTDTSLLEASIDERTQAQLVLLRRDGDEG